MRVYAEGERVICLMTSGNLSVTQSVVSVIKSDSLLAMSATNVPHLMNPPTLFATARYIGARIRRVADMDRAALERDGFSFNINMIVGGQIAGLPPQIHYVYPQGNSLKANIESPFLQIGEYKYGKPVLDRGFGFDTKLSDAVKFAILSMEATVKSNVSVGPPFDLFVYETDSLAVKYRRRLEDGDPYFRETQRQVGEGILQLVQQTHRMVFPSAPPKRRAGPRG